MTRKRTTVLCDAARELVRTLEGLNLRCILIGEMAAFLHGAPTVPKVIKAFVVAPIPGTRLKDNVALFLVRTNPLKFHIRPDKIQNNSPMVAYFDSTVAPHKTDWCNLELVTVSNPPPPEFLPECIIRLGGIPVPPLLPVFVHVLRDLLAHYDSVKTGRLGWKPPKKFQKMIKKLATAPFTGSVSADILDEASQNGALALLKRAHTVSLDLSPHIRAFTRRCQMKGYLPSLDDSPITEIEDFGFVVNDDRQEPLNDTTAGSTIFPKHQEFELEASTSQLIPPIHPTLPPQSITHTLSRTDVVCRIATQVVEILRRIGVDCAVFGSLGCYLYGNDRSPNDIDLVAFPLDVSITDEELKRAVADLDSENFFLGVPRDLKATFRILYFIVDNTLAPSNTFHQNKCKIDILLPGTLRLPSLPKHEIKWRYGLPVIPFPLLLLQKLQGWDDHRKMSEHHKYEKQFTDAADVHNLLKLEHVVALRFSQPWSNRTLFCHEFQGLSLRRVQEFCREYPATTNDWVRLGLHL